MNFKRGKEVKDALRIGVEVISHHIVDASHQKLGHSPSRLPLHMLIKSMEDFDKGNFSKNFDPANVFITIEFFNKKEELRYATPRLRALQGEWIEIRGKYFKVPDFPGCEKFHPNNFNI